MRVRLSNEQIHQIVDYLEGMVFQGLGDATKTVLNLNAEDLDDTTLQTLDTFLIFQCIRCGVWREIEEQDGGDTCMACSVEEEEEMFGPAETIPCSDLDNAISLADEDLDSISG